VSLRCYAELNDYLPVELRQREQLVRLLEAATVGGLIAGLGIPAAVVEVVLVNGTSCGLNRVLRDGDRVSLYPMFESFDATPLLCLRGQPLRRVRFVADAHLGRLARYLRLLGFDTLFENDPGDAELARISLQHNRILLSRDRSLLARPVLTHGLWIPETRPREQLVYVVDRLDLYRLFRPFTRCTVCNCMLSPADKDRPDLRLPPLVSARFETFWRCDGCGRVYWQGSHYDRLRELVEQLTLPG
jgi:hypothetical protein